ncbi:hypothetical protein J3A83DRAFT_4357950 [Scleroderma citrinum]
MENDAASAAEQRANAVAKLRRAASLPRMKDGRRPPMHVEAVSDGEKFQVDELQQPEAPPPQPQVPSSSETNPEPDPEQKPGTPEPSTTARKRRSRSRSRSRGSKDFKGKFKPQSPAPHSVTPSNDSSPDDSSPILMSPNFLSPGSPSLYPGPSPPTPMLPTLDAIQRGLIRSNSVAARNVDSLDPAAPSPSASSQPTFGKLARNNTVSGGERSAARMKLFNALHERIREADVEGTSGGEDRERIVHIPPKRRRRRSARHSAGASNRTVATDESSEVLSTSTSTPLVPPATLPPSLPDEQPVPERVATPSATPPPVQPLTINLNETIAGSRETTPVRAEPPSQRKRRSVLVEPDDDVERISPQRTYPALPTASNHPSPRVSPRLPHSPDVPSCVPTESSPGAIGVPVYLSASRSPSRQDAFPSSPFATPHKEISLSSREEEEEVESEDPEEVVYTTESLRRSPYHDAYNRQISWIADPVPESNLPVYDEDEDDEVDDGIHGVVREEDDLLPPVSPHEDSGHQTEESSPRQSSNSKDLVVEREPSPEPAPPVTSSMSSSTAITPNTPVMRISDDSDSSQPAYPQRLSVASRIQSDRSPLTTEFDLDNPVSSTPETPLKREGSISGAWGKIVGALTRSASNSGRRSRTNSVATRERRQNTDSSISRESGGSLASPKVDKHESFGPACPPSQSVMQSPSASASMQSLALQTPPRSGVSPIPPASSVDLAKYKDAKLFPFPGMKKLEEERRNRGLSISSSTPDIVLSLHTNDNEMPVPLSSSSNTPSHSPDIKRDRTLSHQASDTHLLPKFKSLNSPPLSTSVSTSSRDHFNGQTPTTPQSIGSLSIKLPTNREGVRKWLSKFGQSSSSATTPPTSASQSRPAPSRKPSLSDLLRLRKENDITSDWEEISSEKVRTPTSTSTFSGKPVSGELSPDSASGSFFNEDTQKTPRASKIARSNDVFPSSPAPLPPPSLPSPPTPSPPEPASSATPEPWSSLSDYPQPTTSESSSNTSSRDSDDLAKGAMIMERLNEIIGRGPRSSAWPNVIDEPPRKLILAAPVLQVVNSNTVKDRFLMLFNDILIIAKPIVQDPDVLLELTKPNPTDRKFIVKNVVLLRNLCFSGDREEAQSRIGFRNPLIQSFVEQFSANPDNSIVSLFTESGQSEDPAALAQLLFRTLEIDRAQLGDYLSRRSSRIILKHYLDAFGFTGVRVDKALRIFLQTVHIPTQVNHGINALDTTLDSFASRWYEANASHVAYDRDLAYRFTRAIVQLNDVLHGGITSEPGPTGYVRRNVTARDFLDAFRRQDPRSLLSDDTIGDVYDSIRRERLSQARHPSSAPPDIAITFKRPLPPRLTYRVQSEPAVVRIPQPDPNFAIELFGQDLTFDPPILTFAKSPEASFRITGTSFGLRTMTMLRSGPNALLYSNLPQSFSISVERAFMRNTFQVALLNHAGHKRRYMFSFADPLVRHEWTTSLKRLTEMAASAYSATADRGPVFSMQARFNQAVSDIVFKVLQETLIGPDTLAVPPTSKLSNAPRCLSPQSQSRNGSQLSAGPRESPGPSADLARSKSRSRMYYRHGPGKLELENAGSALSQYKGNREDGGDDGDARSRPDDRIWSGKDLEVFCRQNSSIAQVLELLLPTASEPALQSQ